MVRRTWRQKERANQCWADKMLRSSSTRLAQRRVLALQHAHACLQRSRLALQLLRARLHRHGVLLLALARKLRRHAVAQQAAHPGAGPSGVRRSAWHHRAWRLVTHAPLALALSLCAGLAFGGGALAAGARGRAALLLLFLLVLFARVAAVAFAARGRRRRRSRARGTSKLPTLRGLAHQRALARRLRLCQRRRGARRAAVQLSVWPAKLLHPAASPENGGDERAPEFVWFTCAAACVDASGDRSELWPRNARALRLRWRGTRFCAVSQLGGLGFGGRRNT